MSVGRIGVRSVDVAEMDESTTVAAQRMHARNVGMLVVVDKEQRPLGVVTDRDLVVRVLAESRDPSETTLGEVMNRLPHTANEEMPIEEALGIMRFGPYRRLPVVNREGRLVGILSLDDIIDLLAEEFGEIGKLLRKESPQSLATP
jgi:CBS domain-containing protein